MTVIQFLTYYNQPGEVPADQFAKYNSILSLLKNRYGTSYRELITGEDHSSLEEIIAFQHEFMQQFHSTEGYRNMLHSRLADNAECSREFIYKGKSGTSRNYTLLSRSSKMTEAHSPAAGIYVPILNEKTIKRINHWDLGLVNNDWHLHRNYYQHIQEILHFYQDYAAGKFHYFNVLRFYLEDSRLENNEDIDSICLGLVIHARQQMAKKKMKYQAGCASGDLYRADKDGLLLKAVENLDAKFKQFTTFARNWKWQKSHRIFIIHRSIIIVKNHFNEENVLCSKYAI